MSSGLEFFIIICLNVLHHLLFILPLCYSSHLFSFELQSSQSSLPDVYCPSASRALYGFVAAFIVLLCPRKTQVVNHVFTTEPKMVHSHSTEHASHLSWESCAVLVWFG